MTSLMETLAREALHALARFLDTNSAAVARFGATLREAPCNFAITSARGSSDVESG